MEVEYTTSVNSSNVTSYVASLATPTNYACMRDAFSVHMYIHSAIIHVSLHTHAHTYAHMHTHTHIQYRIVFSFQCFEKISSSSCILSAKVDLNTSKLWPSKSTKAKGNRIENHHVKMEEMTPMRLQKSKEASITVQPGTAAN